MTPLGIEDARIPRWMVWLGGPAFIVFSLAFMLLARVLPVPSPTASSAEITELFSHHTTAIRVGLTLLLISVTLWGLWAACLTVMMRRMEGRFPIITYVSLIMVAAALAGLHITVVFWMMAAFRPDQVSPELTRAFNDIGWILFIVMWPPFGCFWFLTGLAIWNDKNDPPIFPHWVAWTSFAVSVLTLPALAAFVFKTGPLAWDGLIAFYVAMGAFFAWTINMTVFMLKAITTDAQRGRSSTNERPSRSPVEMPVGS